MTYVSIQFTKTIWQPAVRRTLVAYTFSNKFKKIFLQLTLNQSARMIQSIDIAEQSNSENWKIAIFRAAYTSRICVQ